MKKQIILLLAMLSTDYPSKSQALNREHAQNYSSAFEQLQPIPASYQLESFKRVQVDQQAALLFRYVTTDNKALLGEHFSFIMAEKSKQILGFMYADKKYAGTDMLSKAETEGIAKAFLQKMDPQLANDLENLWIAQHDEQLRLANATALTISGMKYKCYRPATNDYSWVIIGFDGSILSYERNIRWDMKAQKRLTEKWLHDDWLLEMGY